MSKKNADRRRKKASEKKGKKSLSDVLIRPDRENETPDPIWRGE